MFFNIPDRCTELNLRSSSSYRLYNNNVPIWLRDRPREFVTHCLGRLSSAMETPSEDIRMLEGGKFTVRSQTSGKNYTLCFQNENHPTCECEDWKRNHWPCKHFMAVFINYEQWGWNSLPATYTENPYFTLDPSIIKTTVNQEENKTTVKEKSSPEPSVLQQSDSENDSLNRQQLCISQKVKKIGIDVSRALISN